MLSTELSLETLRAVTKNALKAGLLAGNAHEFEQKLNFLKPTLHTAVVAENINLNGGTLYLDNEPFASSSVFAQSLSARPVGLNETMRLSGNLVIGRNAAVGIGPSETAFRQSLGRVQPRNPYGIRAQRSFSLAAQASDRTTTSTMVSPQGVGATSTAVTNAAATNVAAHTTASPANSSSSGATSALSSMLDSLSSTMSSLVEQAKLAWSGAESTDTGAPASGAAAENHATGGSANASGNTSSAGNSRVSLNHSSATSSGASASATSSSATSSSATTSATSHSASGANTAANDAANNAANAKAMQLKRMATSLGQGANLGPSDLGQASFGYSEAWQEAWENAGKGWVDYSSYLYIDRSDIELGSYKIIMGDDDLDTLWAQLHGPNAIYMGRHSALQVTTQALAGTRPVFSDMDNKMVASQGGTLIVPALTSSHEIGKIFGNKVKLQAGHSIVVTTENGLMRGLIASSEQLQGRAPIEMQVAENSRQILAKLSDPTYGQTMALLSPQVHVLAGTTDAFTMQVTSDSLLSDNSSALDTMNGTTLNQGSTTVSFDSFTGSNGNLGVDSNLSADSLSTNLSTNTGTGGSLDTNLFDSNNTTLTPNNTNSSTNGTTSGTTNGTTSGITNGTTSGTTNGTIDSSNGTTGSTGSLDSSTLLNNGGSSSSALDAPSLPSGGSGSGGSGSAGSSGSADNSGGTGAGSLDSVAGDSSNSNSSMDSSDSSSSGSAARWKLTIEGGVYHINMFE